MSESYLGRDCRSLNTFPNSYEILSIHQSISTLVYNVPTFPRSHVLNFSHVTRLPFVPCPFLGNPHRSPIRWLTISTSPSSRDTSPTRSITNNQQPPISSIISLLFCTMIK